MINKLALIGVGLIGGSLARALRDAGHVREVIGYGRGLANLQRAVELGVVDRIETSLSAAVRDADMVVLATPVGSMAEILDAIAPYLAKDAVVTDVGSVKSAIVAAARAALGEKLNGFVPGHPIAGTERTGVEASFSSLFVGRRVVLTPLPETSAEAMARVRAMWQAAGAEVVSMSVEHHDTVLAATSHLPHLLAYALVDMLAHLEDSREIFAYAAGGFRDFTRIASSDPVMWRDISLANRDAIVNMLKKYRIELDGLIAAVAAGDGAKLQILFAHAKAARDALVTNDQK
ncbi:MAG TPA: prephenate dehydrogenase/arogenate dehydrogenase family protein [Acidiferrobacterales bacterium]|nr:prephenate dehydrogenase/arogenate dehydrogenase family protein [Acidiferrobacterales bacterium]